MRNSRQSGYALLLVLVTLTLCGVALTELATRTLQANVDSLESMRGLQMRWGRLSCSRTVLREAPALFDELQRQLSSAELLTSPAFPSIIKESISLGGQEFTIIVADENAKLNLNALRRSGRPATLGLALRGLLGPNHFRSLRDLNRGSADLAWGSWGEVFDLDRLRDVEGSHRALAEVTRGLTLWGSGKLNIHRASDHALELTCKGVVTDGLARRVVERHQEAPTLETDLLLRQAVLNETDRGQLEMLLGDGSSAFSVWLECVDTNLHSQYFSVRYVDDEGRDVTEAFSLN